MPRKTLFASLEELSPQEPQEPKFYTGPEISLEEEIQVNVDAVNLENQIANQVGEIDHAQDVISALEDLAFVADVIREPNPTEAALIQIVGDSAVAGTDVSPDTITPAMEEAADGKGIATRVREVVRKLIEGVKTALKKLWAWMKSFFTKTDKINDAQMQRLDRLMARIRLGGVGRAAFGGGSYWTLEIDKTRFFNKDKFTNADFVRQLKAAYAAVEKLDKLNKALPENAEKNAKAITADIDKIIIKSTSPNVPIFGKKVKTVQAEGSPFKTDLYEYEEPILGLKVTYPVASMVAMEINPKDFSKLQREASENLEIRLRVDELDENFSGQCVLEMIVSETEKVAVEVRNVAKAVRNFSDRVADLGESIDSLLDTQSRLVEKFVGTEAELAQAKCTAASLANTARTLNLLSARTTRAALELNGRVLAVLTKVVVSKDDELPADKNPFNPS